MPTAQRGHDPKGNLVILRLQSSHAGGRPSPKHSRHRGGEIASSGALKKGFEKILCAGIEFVVIAQFVPLAVDTIYLESAWRYLVNRVANAAQIELCRPSLGLNFPLPHRSLLLQCGNSRNGWREIEPIELFTNKLVAVCVEAPGAAQNADLFSVRLQNADVVFRMAEREAAANASLQNASVFGYLAAQHRSSGVAPKPDTALIDESQLHLTNRTTGVTFAR